MSTEQERADQYDAHIDDPDEWGDPEPPPPGVTPTQRLRMSITIRLTDEESAWVRSAAREQATTYSDVVRQALRAQLAPPATQDRRPARSYSANTRLEFRPDRLSAGETANGHEPLQFS